jgi:FecR protein
VSGPPYAHAHADVASVRVVQRARLVWAAMALSALAFVGLCLFLSYLAAGFLSSFTVAKTATVESTVEGVGLAVQHKGTTVSELVSASAPTPVYEGDTVASPSNGRAFFRLFDESTINTSFNTQIVLDKLRVSQFFQNAEEISITVSKGTALVSTSDLNNYTSSQFTVSTSQAQIDLQPTSKVRFRVEGEGEEATTQVVVEAGGAVLFSRGKRIDLKSERMAWVTGGGEPQGPVEAEEDLIRDGDFRQGPTAENETISGGGLGIAAWLPIRDEGAPPVAQSSVTITEELGLSVARILYDGGEEYARVGMKQDINRSVEFLHTIELVATVKLVSQDEGVRGPRGEIFPLTIRVVYTDSLGKLHEWKRSFYYQGSDPDPSDVTKVKIPPGTWKTTAQMLEERLSRLPEGPQDLQRLNKDQLFVLKSPTNGLDVAFINAIEVFGYGTQFQSWLTAISLMAR